MKPTPSSAAFLFLADLTGAAATHCGPSHRQVRRQVSQLRDGGYDFIIAGGGTAGLTVADRLSEAFPEKTVLVVEYGDVEYAPGTFDPPLATWGGRAVTATRWDVVPQPEPRFRNKTPVVYAGQVVGGSSAINGMFFDRPARQDLDDWDDLAGNKNTSNRWNWDTIYPYFKKSVTFTAPSATDAQKYGYTWDASVYGSTTSIYSSFPPFLWADHHIVRNAWSEIGARALKECASGNKSGLCWVPISQHPVTARRSHAGVGHYLAVNATRSNYDLLVKHQVVRVVWPTGDPTSGPPVVQVRPLSGNQTIFSIPARAEVILSAGVFNTPAILQRSGIGKSSILAQAGINTIIDLPGVGSNLQDHSGAPVSWNLTKPVNQSPLPEQMADPAFLADATAGFNETPARGPYTLGNSNSAIYIPFSELAGRNKTESIVNKIRESIKDGTAFSTLPADYRDDTTLKAGYAAQLETIARIMSDPETPSLESTWASGNNVRAVNLHPLSRGTVRLNLTHPFEFPVVIYGTGSNRLDIDVYIEHIRYLRRTVAAPAMQKYGAIETGPGLAAQSDEELIDYVSDNIVFSFMHPCCTAAMLPREKGGVVDTDLAVYGANGLRVVDMSALPVLPSAHLSALAYAVGERAADVIAGAWRV